MTRALVWTTIALSLATGLPAAAEDDNPLDAFFPPIRLDLAQSTEHLTAAQLGPGAQRYGQTDDTDTLGTELERQVEAALLGDRAEELAASSALRKYTHDLLSLCRVGQPMEIHQWFLAEHAGLVHPPSTLGMFTGGEDEASDIAEFIQPLVREALKDDRVSAVVVHLDPIEGGYAGLVTTSRTSIDFEPFDRVYEPGATATIPGTVLSSRERYQLFIAYPGTEVRTYDLGGEGAFDIEIPLPEEPGAYRVAMARVQKQRAPDSPFFFTLYVGQPAPSSFNFQAPMQTLQSTLEATEDDFLAKVNDARAAYGLSRLQPAGSREGLRDILASAPEKEFARYRYLTQAFSADPAPEIPHGPWASTWSQGVSSADAAWMALQHPVSRSVLLDERAASVRIGGQATDHGYWMAATLMHAAAEAGATRQQATETLAAKWKKTPAPAPDLQAELDALATRVVGGSIDIKKAFKEIGKLRKDSTLLGGSVTMAAVAGTPAQPPDLSDISLAPGAKYLAIGEASGDFGSGNGLQQTLLIIVTATNAQ